ncbi:MAG: HIG1 domain-containing protein [Hyphomonadaceae bacterium]|nr:HIG1 domain-containing protein [Hyphomonadaceae bacterium]
MPPWLTQVIFFGVLGAVFIVLTLGVVNLVRTDAQARSRSNKLMRLRVLVQFIAIIVLVLLGWAVSALRQ